MIISGEVQINGITVSKNTELLPEDEISSRNNLLREGKKRVYYAYYKPRGVETTLNENISNNLGSMLRFEEAVFPVGRLDKASEGLLLLTNDGTLYDRLLRKEHLTEKEYLVTVDGQVDDAFVTAMSSGIRIMGKMTLPCKVEKTGPESFRIILVQGLNRQIRRMCYKLGYEVLQLVRVRMGDIHLLDLGPGDFRQLEKRPLDADQVFSQ